MLSMQKIKNNTTIKRETEPNIRQEQNSKVKTHAAIRRACGVRIGKLVS